MVALISASFMVLAPHTTRSAQEQVIRMTAKKFEYSPNGSGHEDMSGELVVVD